MNMNGKEPGRRTRTFCALTNDSLFNDADSSEQVQRSGLNHKDIKCLLKLYM